LFNPYVEVVLHDTKKNRVAAIFNNYSGRNPGDDSLLENPAGLARGPSVHGPFEKRSKDGGRIKYSSAVLRNRKNQVVGMMCINVDVQVLDKISGALQMFLRTEDSTALDELFDDNWQERINTFVNDYLKEKGLTLSRLTKTSRIDLVRSLQEAGAFRAKNAANYVAGVLGVSRATVYNDLSEIEND
jgi:predicted transcriptional regulator YheO